MTSEAVANYSTEIDSFLEALYGDSHGYIYAPAKGESEYWQPYWFKWPEHRVAITTHLLRQSSTYDVYVSPSLFKAPSDKREAWKGSNFIWVEFDGNAPKDSPVGIPSPTIRVQSSVKQHEHWYWKLDSYESDYHALEGLTKSLTYTLDADKSGWECNQVLRPPGTLHHESKRRVRLLSQNDKRYSYTDFKNLVVPPETVVNGSNFTDLPDVVEVVGKYKWPKEATALFNKKTQPVGSRSSAMTALGFFCVEMGMTNEECYVVLYNADDRWGKYRNRPPNDRAKRLVGIIEHCRSKKELDAELLLSERESFITIGDFRRTSLKVKWIYEDFLAEQGLGIISAAPGIGKSTLSIRLGIAVVLGKDFLIWKNKWGQGKKVGFVSLEMAGLECRKFLDDMWPSFTEEEQAIIEKNFYLLPLGYSLPLGDAKQQQMLMDEIDKHGLDFLIIDSLKAATKLDERKLDLFFDWVHKHLRIGRKCTVWIIHHNRKPPNEGPRKPRDLGDLYGDTFIGAHPTSVISLWRLGKSTLEVLPLKIRLAEEADPFMIRRSPFLDFTVEGKTSVHTEETEATGDSALFNRQN